MNLINISLIQTNLIWEDKNANISNFDILLTRLSKCTDVIVLPEMFTTGFSMNSKALSESMDGETVNWMKSNAAKMEAIITGSLIIEEDGNIFNRMIWAIPNGEIKYYDKKHLFTPSKENEFYQSGIKKLIVEYKGWKICPMICYDLRFPEWSRNKNEYDLLIYSANWPKARSDHWRSLLKARAIENQCYTVGVNRVGKDGNDLEYCGNTMAYDFGGNLLDEAIDIEKIIQLNFEKEKLLKYRKKLPFLQDQEGMAS
ncbi:MAG: amidohydrolase [Saprospiraceae bacterium]